MNIPAYVAACGGGDCWVCGPAMGYSMSMVVMFWLFGAAALLELLLAYVRPLWRWRAPLSVGITALAAFASGGIAAWQPTVFSVLLVAVTLYRVINMMRITYGRMHVEYLRWATRRTSTILLAVQAGLVGAWWVWHAVAPQTAFIWTVAASLQLAAAGALFVSLLRRMRHTRWLRRRGHLSDAALPTVTVAIPARNETEDLERCLRQIIANDYPKLEILVLDDCSQTRRTSEIIRGFAHDGVRFIQGEEPTGAWLPKNQAYARLAEEASGQYLLFCGVDVRLGPESIRQLIHRMLTNGKEMIAILPYRLDGAGNTVTQGLRYWWELVPPRRLFRRPPVLSTCWAISRQLLEDSGGFQAVARSITPEAHFARQAALRDAYSFVRATTATDIASVKSPAEQRATLVRTRYPQLHRRPENVLAVTLAELFFLVLPFVQALGGYWLGLDGAALWLSVGASLVLMATYIYLSRATRTGAPWAGPFGLPAVMLYDLGMAHYSMWLYEFSTVEWKGRNICIPAMHVTPHLPKID